jgi:hypothetical protein
MRLWNRIQEEAQRLADRADARIGAIEAELSEIHAKRLMLQIESEALSLAAGRLSDFKVSLGTNYLCPYCWMEHRKLAIMPVVSAETEQQTARCRMCDHELSA